MKFTTIFFDLDDTIYPHESGLWEAIKARISQYMHDELGMSWDEIPPTREKYFLEYGTTLRGIQAHFDIDPEAYHAYVHHLPLDEYIAPDPDLIRVLEQLPQQKIIFTSADTAHAERVLDRLQIRKHFVQIIDVYAIEPYIKPQPNAFHRALELAGEHNPQNCMMIDDLPRTTRAARAFGMFSILKGDKGNGADANAQLRDWNELPEILG